MGKASTPVQARRRIRKVQRHPLCTFVSFVIKAFKGINHKGHEDARRKHVVGPHATPAAISRATSILEVTHARRTSNLSARKRDPQGDAEWPRLQGVPRDGRYLGPPEGMSYLRSRRVLRFLQEQTRHEALSPDQASHHSVFRAGRELALVLRGRSISDLGIL